MLILYPCTTFRQRLLGLHGVKPLGADEGLWIVPCAAVHTLGLTRVLDVVFLDARAHIIHVCAHLRPNRVAWCWRAHSVVELSAGFCARQPDFAVHIARQCCLIRQRWRDDFRRR